MAGVLPGLQLAIVIQCLIFGIYLYRSDRLNLMANRVNFCLIAVLAVQMTFNVVNHTLFERRLANGVFAFGALYGPLIYLYLRALIYRQFVWRRHYWLHFLPFVVLSWPPFWGHSLAIVLVFVSLLLYLLLAYTQLRHFRDVLRHTQADVERMAMQWANWVLLSNALALGLNVVAVFVGQANVRVVAELILMVVLLVMINAFIFQGLLQPQRFAGITVDDETIAAAPISSTKDTMDQSQQQALLNALLQHMAHNKPYRDPLFHLQALARQIGQPPRIVSMVINQQLQQTFSEFVNQHRLDDVKRQLADPDQQQDVLAIAFDAGFSTKSNFNRVFKQREGVTPSAYRQQHTNPAH